VFIAYAYYLSNNPATPCQVIGECPVRQLVPPPQARKRQHTLRTTVLEASESCLIESRAPFHGVALLKLICLWTIYEESTACPACVRGSRVHSKPAQAPHNSLGLPTFKLVNSAKLDFNSTYLRTSSYTSREPWKPIVHRIRTRTSARSSSIHMVHTCEPTISHQLSNCGQPRWIAVRAIWLAVSSTNLRLSRHHSNSYATDCDFP
jgi:hypothetical protein